MKKKIFLMVFIFIALLFIGATNVNADEIGDVILDGTSIIPVAGGTPQMLTVPADAPYEIAEQGWFDFITGNPITVFEEGNVYYYAIVLRPKSGYSFTKGDVPIIKGISWGAFEAGFVDSDTGPYYGCLGIDAMYIILSSSINSIVLDGTSIVPVAGGTPQMLTVPEDAPYEIAEQIWSEFETYNSIETFEEGKSYIYTMVLRPKSGYSFTETDVVIIEGVPWFGFYTSLNDNGVGKHAGCLVIEGSYKVLTENQTIPEEETPIEEENPNEEETPIEEENPNEEETPIEEENPNEEETPIEEENPNEEETPIEEENQNEDETINEEKHQIEKEISITPEGENPQTGDKIAVFIVLGLISIVGLTGVKIYKIKK